MTIKEVKQAIIEAGNTLEKSCKRGQYVAKNCHDFSIVIRFRTDKYSVDGVSIYSKCYDNDLNPFWYKEDSLESFLKNLSETFPID